LSAEAQGNDPLVLAMRTCREEDRLPRPKPWPWAILAEDEEFAREYEDHLGIAEAFWLVRVVGGDSRSPGSWRLVAEEREPRRWWVCDIVGPRSFGQADSIAQGLVAAYDLGRRGRSRVG